MAKIVVVGCKLPHGLILEHPMDVSKKVELAGLNKAIIIGAEYASTEVDADFWDQWAAIHKDHPAIKSGAIFVAKNAAEIVAVAAEHAKEETGLEPMRNDGKDKRAKGVKTASTKDE